MYVNTLQGRNLTTILYLVVNSNGCKGNQITHFLGILSKI
jgi:hypothetical protein